MSAARQPARPSHNRMCTVLMDAVCKEFGCGSIVASDWIVDFMREALILKPVETKDDATVAAELRREFEA